MNKFNVPKLRFKGFECEWEGRKFGSLGEFKGGGTPSTTDKNHWDGKIPWISSSDICDGNLHNINIHRFLTEDAIKESATKIIPANSILLVSRVGVGKLAVNRVDLCTSQDFCNFIPTKCDSYFLGYLLISKKQILINFAQGTSIKGFTTGDIKTLLINLPSLPEQQKIASFLTAVDEKIQQLSRKKELLAQYKKGVMQKLFSGKLRFKDDNGNDYADWEEKKLGEVAEKRIVKNKENKINLVFTNSASQGIVNQRDYFDKDIANQNNLLGYYIVENNDFVYNPRISTHAPVGPISRNYLDTGIMSPLYSVFRFKEGNLDFIEYFFNSVIWHKHMQDISNYGARDDRMSFSTADFYKMPITFPCLEEQQKIANFLSNIDLKIENTNQEINQMKNFKKGLLQQMFV